MLEGPARLQDPRPDAPVQVWGSVPLHGSTSFFRNPDGYLIRFHGIADFVMSANGANVRCHPVPQACVPWDQVYRQQVVPLQRAQQGQAVFHGGAVCRQGWALALLAPSGQGKSTLTAGCAASGMPFLTDDCLVLQSIPELRVVPDAGHIRLWTDSYVALGGNVAPTPPETQRKQRLPASLAFPRVAEPMPLACMIALDGEVGDAIVLERLAPSDAAMRWCANAFVVDQRLPQVLHENLQRGARLAETIPAYRLAYPRDYARLPEVVAAVSMCLDAAVAERTA
jgi:hypothetical protein